ncbi:MAG: MBL fold metallo-hydrolase [Planctomycetota bacterium]
MTARLVVLGAGAIVPRAGYGPAGYALEREPEGPITLLDCGPGTLRSLPAAGFDPVRIERVVVSHFHPDHVLDLFALALYRRIPGIEERVPHLELIGPVGLARLVERAPDLLGRAVAFEDFDVREIETDEDGFGHCSSGPFDLRCAATGHTPQALAWRLEAPGMDRLTYSGDSGAQPRLGELAKGSDVLVIECSFADGAGTPNHLTPSGVATLVRAARPGRVLLTHFYPDTDPAECARQVRDATGAEVSAAHDGFELKLSREPGS